MLISVVTDLASITSALVIGAPGCSGELNDTYLPPNTVVDLIEATTLTGISGRYCGDTSKVNFATGLPSRSVSLMLATWPIPTPLKVTFDPGPISKPARSATSVNDSFGVKPPRNCTKASTPTSVISARPTAPAVLYRGLRGAFSVIGVVMAATP